MPDLTPEQKEHLKMTHRANLRIDETWQIFNMYLADGKKPAEALELALDAVEVWSAWMSQNEVEPPDIPQPNFGQQIVDSMGQMFAKMPTLAAAAPRLGYIVRDNAGERFVDAEFPAESSTRTSDPNTAADPNSNT